MATNAMTVDELLETTAAEMQRTANTANNDRRLSKVRKDGRAGRDRERYGHWHTRLPNLPSGNKQKTMWTTRKPLIFLPSCAPLMTVSEGPG
jgi:hypothetical protein